MAEFDSNPVGEKLRTAREARGLALDDVVARTRIPTRHLEAIENGDWDALPASTYTVGFARSYANVVGLNGSEIAAELRALLNTRQGIVPQPAYEPTDPARMPPRLLVISAVLIALLLIGGYAIWRQRALGGNEGTEVPIAEAPSAPAKAPTAAPAPPAPTTGPVALTATDQVWLRIYEHGGKRIYEGILGAGQRYEVPAAAQAPMIMTGRPDALKVTVGATEIPPLGPPQRRISDVSLLPHDLLARVGNATPGPVTPPPVAQPAPMPSPGAL